MCTKYFTCVFIIIKLLTCYVFEGVYCTRVSIIVPRLCTVYSIVHGAQYCTQCTILYTVHNTVHGAQYCTQCTILYTVHSNVHVCCLLNAAMFKSLHVLWQHFTTVALLTTALLGAQLLRYFYVLLSDISYS